MGSPVAKRPSKIQKKKNKKTAKPGFFRRVSGYGPLPTQALRWILFLGVSGALAGAAVLFLLYQVIEIPDPNEDFRTNTTTVYYADGKSKIGTFANQNRQSIEVDKMSDNVKNAVVAAEDRTFWRNQGIDVRGIVRAARDNAASGEITGGASTITQQYVKILYLSQERTFQRKIKEVIISAKIHRKLTKNEILEGYLNTIYFGNGAYGVEVASQTYFRKPASKLTVPEAAFLATVINLPSYYDPYAEGGKDRILPRYNYVLDGMAQMGSISATDAAKYRGKLPKFAKKRVDQRYAGSKGFLLDMVKKEMINRDFGAHEIDGGGLKIVTTFDKNAQKAAAESLQAIRPQGLSELNSALVAVEPGTGAVRALYGGPDYLKSELNWATLGTQPGSTFKVFAVIAALRDGYSLKTRLNGNSPIRIGHDEISNQGDSGGRSYGSVSLQQATEHSVNTAFVDITDQMERGPEKILYAARDAGIPQATVDAHNPVIGVSLGYAPVAPIDMANAYATLAADGKRAEWHVVQSVSDRHGARLFEHRVATTQTVEKDVAADTLAALQTVTRSGTGTRGRTFCPTAGKTGTATAGSADNSRVSSSWFVGATPKLATAVMFNRGVGNEELEGYLNPFFGGTYPAMTFRSFMEQVLDPASCGTFPKPANIKAEKGSVVKDKPKPTKTTKPTKEPTTDPDPDPEPTTPPTTVPTTPPTTPPTTAPTEPAPGHGGGGPGGG